VNALAKRIASFPAPAVRMAKEAIDASTLAIADGLAEESFLFQKVMREPSARRAMARFLEIGGQTRDGELKVAELAAKLSE